MPMWMVRVNDIIDTLGAHNLLVTPSSNTFDDPRMRQLLERYMPGANGMSAQERSRIFRTAWDFSGSALGSRVELYERFPMLADKRRAAARCWVRPCRPPSPAGPDRRAPIPPRRTA